MAPNQFVRIEFWRESWQKVKRQLSFVVGYVFQNLQIPTCEGSILTVNARDESMARYSEGTSFFACVMPCQGGYALNTYTTFTKASGAFSAATLGATLARAVVGNSSQFIPRTIARWLRR